MKRKLADIWLLVLLRGLIEGSLLLMFFFPEAQSVEGISVFFGATLLGGSLVELVMAWRLPGHPFRGILVFVGVAGSVVGAFLLYNFPATMNLLWLMTGLWVALRGFAALWLGLSIVSGTFDRLVPALAGLLGLLVGAYAMIFMRAEPQTYILLIAAYAFGAAVIHIVVALRMGLEERRLQAETSAQQEAPAKKEQPHGGR